MFPFPWLALGVVSGFVVLRMRRFRFSTLLVGVWCWLWSFDARLFLVVLRARRFRFVCPLVRRLASVEPGRKAGSALCKLAVYK